MIPMTQMTPMIRMISCLELFFSSGSMGRVGSGKMDVHGFGFGGVFQTPLGAKG